MVKPTTGQRAAIYVRIAKDDGTALGVDRQEKDCRALATLKGWTVVEPAYSDNDLGAYGLRKARPDYSRLMSDIASGRVDALVVYNIDRLYRHPRELEDLIDLCEKGTVAFATCSGEYDLSTSDGRFMARMMVNIANKSSADASRRLKRKHLDLAEKGKTSGGPLAFGYTRDGSINPVQADQVVQIATSLLNGGSLTSECNRLN